MKKKEKSIDTKVDELARMVAQGFTDTNDGINRVEARVERIEENCVIKADLVMTR